MLEFYGLDYTTKDHPGLFSLVLYTSWCNFRCYWCHNRRLAWWDYENWEGGIWWEKISIDPKEYFPKLTLEEVKSALNTEFLDMVILCWWEVLINKLDNVIETIKWIKKLRSDVLIRIDTNGSFPEKVKVLKEKKLVNWFAIDIKWPYWSEKFYPDISKVIWLPEEVLPNLTKKIMESIHLADELNYTLFRTVHYPIIKNQEYFEEIKRYVRQNLKSPYSINPFIEV